MDEKELRDLAVELAGVEPDQVLAAGEWPGGRLAVVVSPGKKYVFEAEQVKERRDGQAGEWVDPGIYLHPELRGQVRALEERPSQAEPGELPGEGLGEDQAKAAPGQLEAKQGKAKAGKGKGSDAQGKAGKRAKAA